MNERMMKLKTAITATLDSTGWLVCGKCLQPCLVFPCARSCSCQLVLVLSVAFQLRPISISRLLYLRPFWFRGTDDYDQQAVSFFLLFWRTPNVLFFWRKKLKSNKTKQRTQPRSVRRTGDMCRHLLWMLAAFCSELCSTIGASKRPPPHTPTCWLTVTALQPVLFNRVRRASYRYHFNYCVLLLLMIGGLMHRCCCLALAATREAMPLHLRICDWRKVVLGVAPCLSC